MIVSGKMEMARKTVDRVGKLTGAVEISLEAYANGREQGYTLANFHIEPIKRVAFSEDRTSDNIAVYAGVYLDFSMQGNVPNDKIFKKVKYFRYDQVGVAAQYIAEYLMGGENGD